MKKTGFTLIELLVVILLLGLILVISLPNISNVIENSRKKTFENSVYSLMRTLDVTQKEHSLGSTLQDIEVNYVNGEEISNLSEIKLEYKGKRPKTGVISINKMGEIELALHDGTYCAQKNILNNLLNISKVAVEDCYNIVTFVKTFGGGNGDFFTNVIKTTDGYVVAGYSESDDKDLTDLNYGSMDAILIKYNFNGEVVWKRNFGGSSEDLFYNAALAPDGYVAVGFTASKDFDLTGLDTIIESAIIVKYYLIYV